MALGALPVDACPVCYGETDSTWIDGTRVSVYLLLGIVFVLQISFATFFLKVRSKSKLHMMDSPEEFAPTDGPEAA